MQAAVRCAAHAFLYNGTHCACDPGYILNSRNNSCNLFSAASPAVELSSGVDYGYSSAFELPNTIFSFDAIKKFTQSQAVFLEATLVMLVSWLVFCVVLRCFPLGSDGRSPWFKIRWWISRLDISFATHHWLEDRKPVVKRKTELGGALSIASWILFIGLFAALLYQIISKRSVEVHNVRAINAPDLDSFTNDFEFNITTVSSMSCAQLRGLGTLLMGNPVFGNQRVVPLSTFANYSCSNTTAGPTIVLKCSKCRLVRDLAYISWQFVDLPNNPAAAVGFQFNLTSKYHTDNKHISFVTGTLKNASDFDDTPITYRGTMSNVMRFNLFPRIYRNLNDLKLIQPLFHEFLRGSYFSDAGQLRASLESSSNGLVNTTLCLNFLSSYIVEIDNQNISGPVSFLADLGGLYCISVGIFFFFLVQCEHRVKRLRNEDTVMRSIRSRRKAQDRWKKLRKYVNYTWGSRTLVDDETEPNTGCCNGVASKLFPKNKNVSQRRRAPQRQDTISFTKNGTLPCEQKAVRDDVHGQEIKSFCIEGTANTGISSPVAKSKPVSSAGVERRGHESSRCSNQNQHRTDADIANIPPLPLCDFRESGELSMVDLQENLQKLYQYNTILREKLIAALSKDHISLQNESSTTML